MSQFTYGTIDAATKSGNILATDLNSVLNSWNSNHSGVATPIYSQDAMMWVDTNLGYGDWKLKIRGNGNLTNTILFSIDTVNMTTNLGTLASLIVFEGAGNLATAGVDADTASFKGVGNTGISILSPNANISAMYLGSVAVPTRAQFKMNNSSNVMTIETNIAGGSINFNSGAQAFAMTIMSNQRIGIGTSTPNALSKVHVQVASSGATFSLLVDDFIIDGTGDLGMSVVTNAAGVARMYLGSTTNPIAMGMQWTQSTKVGVIGTQVAGADVQIHYQGSTVGIHLDSTDDYIGIFNSAPEATLHVGGAIPATFSAIGVDNAFVFVGSTLAKMTLVAQSGGAAFQLINTANIADRRLIVMDMGGVLANYFSIAAYSDAFGFKWTSLRINMDTGDIYLPILTPAAEHYVKMTTSGRLITSAT